MAKIKNVDLDVFKQELQVLQAEWRKTAERDYDPFLARSREEFQYAKRNGFRDKVELNRIADNANAKLSSVREQFRDSLYDFAKYKLLKVNILKTMPAKIAGAYGIEGFAEISQRQIDTPVMNDRLVVNIISPKIDVVFNDQGLLSAFKEIQERSINEQRARPPSNRKLDIFSPITGSTPMPNPASSQVKIQLEDFFEHRQQFFGEIFSIF